MEIGMKNRRDRVLLIILTVPLLSLSLYAKPRGKHIVKEKIGQQFYLKRCSSCHSSGKIGGNMATQKEWEMLLSKGAKELIELHRDEKDTDGLINYLHSEEFSKEHNRLLKFLQEFANDSEAIPTCY
jgi:hypothetical protein